MTHTSRPAEPSIDQPYYGASFGAAFVRFWKKGFTFAGRASRSEYWFAYLAQIAVYVLAVGCYSAFSHLGILLFGVFALASLIPQLAVTVRRLHDAGLSGGMYFMSWIPLAGGLILLILMCRPSDARGVRFDHVPTVHSGVALPQVPASAPVPSSVPVTTAMLAVPLPASVPVAPPVPLPNVQMPGASPSAQPEPALISSIPGASPSWSAPAAPVLEPDLDETVISPARTRAEWQIVLADGRQLEMASALRIGRDPISDPGVPGAVLMPIDDPARSLSKTHAQLEAGADGLVVTDLHSTNGTRVRMADGSLIVLVPETPFPVTGTAEISFGDYVVRAQRLY